MSNIISYRSIKAQAKIIHAEHAHIFVNSSYKVTPINTQNLRGFNSDSSIKGLSANALKRLKNALANTRHADDGYTMFGSCLTIPWNSVTQKEGAQLWRAFVHNLNRVLDKLRIGCIYRVELQKRKAPHWHIVWYIPHQDEYQNKRILCRVDKEQDACYLANVKKLKCNRPMVDVGKSPLAFYYAQLIIRALWINACLTFASKHKKSVKTLLVCYDCQPLDGVKSALTYLASHTSKRKQEQLGYQGKQWGYFGRKWLKFGDCQSITPNVSKDCERRVIVRFYRTLRKWAKSNRFRSLWVAFRPRSFKLQNGFVCHRGLVVNNQSQLMAFGLSQHVIDVSLEHARISLQP